MPAPSSSSASSGFAYALAAYGIWGLVLPLYFMLLGGVSPLEVLAHRVFWSVILLLAVVVGLGRGKELGACLRRPALVGALAVSAALIAGNWFVYIYAVMSEQVLQASLGYYVSPLLNVLLGVVFLRERLRPARGLGVALAAVGVAYSVVTLGALPWIALALAGSFAGYALVRKLIAVDGLIGVSVETLLMAPLAVIFLLAGLWHGTAVCARGAGWVALLMVSGVLTAVPLLCFGQASRRLPLSTLGFLQFTTPSLQFVLALVVFRETLTPAHVITFGCIWAGLLLFCLDGARAEAQRPREETGPAPVRTTSERPGPPPLEQAPPFPCQTSRTHG